MYTKRSKRNFQNSKDKRNFTKPTNYEDRWGQEDAGKPEKEGEVNTLIAQKAYKGLPKSNTNPAITPKVDPYTEVLPSSYPYALLNMLNRPVGGRYGGDDNLDGGNTRQFMTSEQSAFLHCFDVMGVNCKVNYRYLPIRAADNVRGKQFTNEMIRAIDEITSLASATTYTSLAVNNYLISTDLPTGTFSPDTDGLFTSASPAGLFAWLIYYQLFLCSTGGAVSLFNKLRSNMGNMMNMSWNRETPRLNSYFGLLKKKSFLAQWDSLCYALEGEYFDHDWLMQYNMIVALTSRRADACTEPVLEILATHNLPKFKLMLNDADKTVVFDTTELDTAAATVGGELPAPYTFTTFAGALKTLSILTSITDTLHWVRNNDSMAEIERFDMISDICKFLVNAANYFKPAMGDLRTCLDVLGRVAVNQWSKGVRLKVIKDTDIKLNRNLTVEHIFQQLGGGSHVMTWNAITYRWSGHSMWNMYTGIPEYDAKAGGAFLSFSTKELQSNGNADAVAYLPVALDTFTNFTTVNRLGTPYTLTIKQFNPAINATSARLIPLPSMSVTCNIPTPEQQIVSVQDASFLMNTCLKVFGCYNTTTEGVTANTDIAVEPDNLCFITYEIEDLSNDMITYARTKGPFKVNVANESSMGFQF